jgi:hypothetical protein
MDIYFRTSACVVGMRKCREMTLFNVRMTVSAGPLTVNLEVYVPLATYIHSTSSRWAVDTPETCRGVIIQ